MHVPAGARGAALAAVPGVAPAAARAGARGGRLHVRARHGAGLLPGGGRRVARVGPPPLQRAPAAQLRRARSAAPLPAAGVCLTLLAHYTSSSIPLPQYVIKSMYLHVNYHYSVT